MSSAHPIMSPLTHGHASSGSMNIPTPSAVNGNGTSGGGGGMGRNFEQARSPPGRQNTSHVPCKFFRQGQCQAGDACPFSHDMARLANEIPCKYFEKGNCKFGAKCANAHILPNGQRVVYKHGQIPGPGHFNIGGRVNTDLYQQSSNSTLTNSFRAGAGAPSPYGAPYPYPGMENGFHPYNARQGSIDIGLPEVGISYASHPGSAYGSPRDDDLANRFGGLSPQNKGLNIKDVPLPASFDTNGISHYAKNAGMGPISDSVPTRFGIDVLSGSSVGTSQDGRNSEAVKNLHSSAFGDDTRDRFNGFGSSPPAADEYFGRRTMHSQRAVKSKGFMSASLPSTDAFSFDPEDLMPGTLEELMTPQEKARRGSRTAEEGGRPIHSGAGTPGYDSPSMYGSPSNTGSPSRFSHLFNRQKEEESSRASAFGHVGSPLRNSSFHTGASPSSSSYLASPPRQSSMSAITQQLAKTRLSRAESAGSESGLNPLSAARLSNNPIGSSNRSAFASERQVSSSSMGNGSGRLTTPIDEEPMFVLEGVDEKKSEKRSSGGPGWPMTGARSPYLGAIGSRTGASTTNGSDAWAGGR